ncbi:MAG: hypothetical protein MHPSP_001856, partial [Paramarteilia canceri]
KMNTITAYKHQKKQKFEVLSEMVANDGITPNQNIKSNFIRTSFKGKGWDLINSGNTVANILIYQTLLKKQEMSSIIEMSIAENQ